MYGFLLAQSLSNMAIGIFTLRQQLRGLLSKNWTGTIKTPYVEYLVVGGGGGAGGGGGNVASGGGAGGGVVTGLLPVNAGATYTATIGGGGAGGGSSSGTSGQNSGLSSVLANGGGGGGYYNVSGLTGGSGGGAGQSGAGLIAGAQGIFGQGNTGGASNFTGSSGGGGGGAGTVGLASGSSGGNGGAGIASAISGTVTPYGGGGGGGGPSAAGTGGVGGGGAGATSGSGTAGQANTGGGGGGAATSGTGGAGGSGIVIVSYPDIYAALTTGGATSPTVSTSGSGSIGFNGSSQYLSVASNTAFSFPADFTFECWVYLTTASGTKTIFTNRSSLGTTGIAWVAQSGSSALSIYTNSAFSAVSSTAISLNTWTHVALTRSGSTITQWLNGVSVATATNSSAFTEAQCYIGANNSAAEFWPGYITNFRILKGTALYTSTFTPPTAPLSVITNTSLLLSSISGAPFADSSTNGFAPNSSSAVAPAWNQSSPFATGLGYKNRVYTWAPTVSAGGTATGTFTV